MVESSWIPATKARVSQIIVHLLGISFLLKIIVIHFHEAILAVIIAEYDIVVQFNTTIHAFPIDAYANCHMFSPFKVARVSQ